MSIRDFHQLVIGKNNTDTNTHTNDIFFETQFDDDLKDNTE